MHSSASFSKRLSMNSAPMLGTRTQRSTSNTLYLGVVHTFIIVLTYSIHDASVLSLIFCPQALSLARRWLFVCMSTMWVEECIHMALVSASSLEVKNDVHRL